MCLFSPSGESKEKKEARLRQEAMDKLAAEETVRRRAIQDQLTAQFGKYLNQDIGYSPEELAAMRGQAIDQIGHEYQTAAGGVNARVLANSGGQPLGGDAVRNYAGLEIARAGDAADAQRNITKANADLALRNRFNAAAILGGNAGQIQNAELFNNSGAQNLFASRLKLAQMPTFGQNLLYSGIGAAAGAAADRYGRTGSIWG